MLSRSSCRTITSASIKRYFASNYVVLSDTKLVKDSGKENPDKAYSKTLLLPKTAFPLWAEPSKREVPFRRRTCDDLYRWQWETRLDTDAPLFVLHDGPPYANGDLHMGHALNKIIKDIINRYHVIRGARVHYIPGWDCHGLPIENKALKKLKKDPLRLPPGVVRSTARAYAEKEVAKQRAEFTQLGVMADWEDAGTYRTIDHPYALRQLRLFQTLVARGLIYRAYRPVYFSPSSRSALAEGELEYVDDHESWSVYLGFGLVDAPAGLGEVLRVEGLGLHHVRMLVWTTTPWTLTANMAIAVNPEMRYTLLRTSRMEAVLVASSRMEALMAEDVLPEDAKVVAEFDGSDLVGLKYRALFESGQTKDMVLSGHVAPESGTGCVHVAPAHGMEDYGLWQSMGRLSGGKGMVCHVDGMGKFAASVEEVVGSDRARGLVGKEVLRDGGPAVLALLEQEKGVLVKTGKLLHRYPVDWRTKEPVIVTATEQWFAALDRIKDDALEALQDVKFWPENSRNRLESFVKGRTEWCISRQRVWGMPIPALYVDTPSGESRAVLTTESLEHILNVLEEKGLQWWWEGPVEDFVPAGLREEGTWRKGTETMDVWFDSGSSWTMLEALKGERRVLADVCVEGSDQHRGWFQSLLLTKIGRDGAGEAPYGTLVTHGMVLDQEGKKMSKTLGNIMSPMAVVNGGKDKKLEPAYGADVLRLWAATVEYWRDMALGPTVLVQAAETLRKIRNSARFILGNLSEGAQGKEWERVSKEDMGLAERYVMHELYSLEQTAVEGYETYNFPKIIAALGNFTNITLSALYFDITKDCLYADAVDSLARRRVTTVLEQALRTLLSVMAPVLPHLAEEIYAAGGMGKGQGHESVFKEGWKMLDVAWNDEQAKRDMDDLLRVRALVMGLLEKARGQKQLRSSLEAEVDIILPGDEILDLGMLDLLHREEEFLKTLFIVSDVSVTDEGSLGTQSPEWTYMDTLEMPEHDLAVRVRPATGHKCPRCWTYTRPAEDKLCGRCSAVIPMEQ